MCLKVAPAGASRAWTRRRSQLPSRPFAWPSEAATSTRRYSCPTQPSRPPCAPPRWPCLSCAEHFRALHSACLVNPRVVLCCRGSEVCRSTRDSSKRLAPDHRCSGSKPRARCAVYLGTSHRRTDRGCRGRCWRGLKSRRATSAACGPAAPASSLGATVVASLSFWK